MLLFDSLRDALYFEMTVSRDEYAQEELFKEKFRLCIEDIEGTISFINDCTDEEFYFLSDVFEDFTGKVPSEKFVQAISDRFERVTRENYRQENFINKDMRKTVDYDTYKRIVEVDVSDSVNLLQYILEDCKPRS